MLESASNHSSESSILLWILATAIAMFAAHVSLGWIRDVQRAPSMREAWPGLLFGAASLGTGVASCMVLALSAEALAFPLGYPLGRVLMLWVLAMVGCLPVCIWLQRSQGWLATLACGLLLAGVALGSQAGWVMAVGFRPGIAWRIEFVIGAACVLGIGFCAAIWAAFSPASRKGRRRKLWRVGAAALLGLSLMAGQEVLLSGVGLASQVGSVYKNHVPAAILCLFAGVIVPLAFSMMAVDLELRRRQQRRHRVRKDSPSTVAPQIHSRYLDPETEQFSGLPLEEAAAPKAAARTPARSAH